MLTAMRTGLALVAFAANSLLCRQALRQAAIDPAAFSVIRLASGAVTLLMILVARDGSRARLRGSWVSAGALFLYAVPFSFAYREVDAGTGALILFGAVQATMILAALGSGDRPSRREWVGLALAVGGLGYLVSPGLEAPSLPGSLLMGLAGCAWGVYSLRGRGGGDALGDTAASFVRALPLAAVLGVITLRNSSPTAEGVILAVASGALASGVGYVLWCAALPGHSATRAAIVQLAVPVLAAAGGVAFLSEAISIRLCLSAVLILGGVGVAFQEQGKRPRGTSRWVVVGSGGQAAEAHVEKGGCHAHAPQWSTRGLETPSTGPGRTPRRSAV